MTLHASDTENSVDYMYTVGIWQEDTANGIHFYSFLIQKENSINIFMAENARKYLFV